MDPDGRNEQPRNASASMLNLSSSTVQKQHRSITRPVTKKKRRQSKPTPTKKKSSSWWEIKDIIDEKLEKGLVKYLVAWEGIDPETDLPYEPSWEPSHNVTDLAIEAWEDRKKNTTKTRSQDISVSRSDPDDSIQQQSAHDREIVQLANNREEEAKLGRAVLRDGGITEVAPKRENGSDPYPRVADEEAIQEASEALRGSEGGQGKHQKGPQTVAELPHKLPSEHLEFQRLLSSHKSQSQPQPQPQPQHPQSGLSQTEISRHAPFSQTRDQRIIPDSQGFSSLSASEAQSRSSRQYPLTTGQLPRETATLSEASGERANSQTTSVTPSITSHQPDHQATGVLNDQHLSIFTTTTGARTSAASPGQQSLVCRFSSENSSQKTNRSGDDRSFLTQLSFELDVASAPLSRQPSFDGSAGPSSERNFSSNAHIPTTQKSVFASVDSISSHTNSQAAQIVPPLSSQPERLLSTSQETFSFYDEEGIARSTVTGQPPQQPSNPQGSSQALDVLNGNTRSSSSAPRACELVLQANTNSLSQSHATSEKSRDRIRAPVHSASRRTLSPVQTRQTDLASGVTTSIVYERPSRRHSLPPTKMQSSRSVIPGTTAQRLKKMREDLFAARGLGQLNQSPDVPVNSSIPPNSATSTPTADQSEIQAPAEANAHAGTEPDLPTAVSPPSLPIMSLETPVEAVEDERPSALGPTQVSNDPLPGDSLPFTMDPGDINYHPPHEEPPATLDPSHLTLSIEERDLSPSIPTDDALAGSAGPEDFIPSVDFSKQSDDEVPQEYSRDLLPYIPSGVNEHLITLPFFVSAGGWVQYNDIIRENEAIIRAYNSCFLVSPYQKPAPSVIAAIDKMFSRLLDYCDFPPYLETALELGREAVTKHVVGSNSKFCFVDEFLLNLNQQGSTKKILILARPGQLVDLLSNIVQTRGYRLIRSGREVDSPTAAQSFLTVAVYSTDEDLSALPNDADAIIAFDHTYRQDLLPPSNEANPPLVLVLTNTDSVQHINMQISESMEPLERKNCLVLAVFNAMKHIEEPDHSIRDPPEIARLFAHYLEMPDTDDFYWEPQEIPEDIFENLPETSSQIQHSQHSLEHFAASQGPGSRKRSHDEIEESASKRPKISQAQVVSSVNYVSDSLRNLLGDGIIGNPDPATITVSIEKLEALSGKITQLTLRLEQSREREREFRQLSDRSKKEVDGYTASINTIQTRFMEALKDRGIFEAECNEATEQARALTSALKSARNENETLKDANADLRKRLSEATESLLTSSVPEASRLARTEKELEEARDKVQYLEKRLALAQRDHEYAKNAYQEASQGTMQLRADNRALEARVEALARQADDNVVRVRQLQARRETEELAQLLSEQRAAVRDRELELGRLREEVRSLRNGRRETRQSSVPRSPRLSAALERSVLSPRTSSAAYPHHHNHHHNQYRQSTPSVRGTAASSSRAASPASVVGGGGGGGGGGGAGPGPGPGPGSGGPQQPQQPPMGVFESPGGNGATAFFGRHAHLRD